MHLDGYNLLPFLRGEEKDSPRDGFLYWSDNGDSMAIRVRNWKISFVEQHTEINPQTPLGVWQGNFLKLRAPNLYNLRVDMAVTRARAAWSADWHAEPCTIW